MSSVRVRLLPEPFSGEPSLEWVRAAGRDTSPDVLDVAAQYLQGAPPVRDANGLRIAGAAGYGEEDSDG